MPSHMAHRGHGADVREEGNCPFHGLIGKAWEGFLGGSQGEVSLPGIWKDR